MLSFYDKRHYDERHHDECYYAECHFAKCRGAIGACPGKQKQYQVKQQQRGKEAQLAIEA